MPTPTSREKDRDLLRAAGEHLGMLAEQEYERAVTATRWHRLQHEASVRLRHLSKQILEIANV